MSNTKREIFQVGDKVNVVNVIPLAGNEVAPELKEGEEKDVLNIHVDRLGNQHLDLGLDTDLNYVRSYETDEILPKSLPGRTCGTGKIIHWCHPTRVKLKLRNI